MKAAFTQKLMQWNRLQNRRAMPWKGERDPYKIWLSEIILQQTRVEQGWAYYEKFIEHYPDIRDLAAAPDEEVFKLWEGLGYYTRCRNLIATARIIVEENNAVFPDRYEDILKLKGVGPYTAAAIASFAFDEPRAVVDGNVQRVLARYFGINTAIDSNEGKKLFSDLADSLLDKKQPGRYNQAIMDFGAVVCKPQQPLCETCIQQHDCVALRLQQVTQLPVKAKAIQKRKRWLFYFIIRWNNGYYIRKRTEKDIWQNLYEFILWEAGEEPTVTIGHSAFVKKMLKNIAYSVEKETALMRQQLTHQEIQGRFMVIQAESEPHLPAEYEWVEAGELNSRPFPRFIRVFLDEYNLAPGKKD